MTAVSTRIKAIAAGLVLALLMVLATVSCGPGIAFLASLAAQQQCTSDGGLATGGDTIPVPSGNPDAKLAFRAASWNVLKSNSVSNVAAGLQAISGTAEVVGLQEFREKFRGATIKNALPGWAWSNQNTSVPITWNADEVRPGRQGPGAGVRRDPRRRRTRRSQRRPEVRRVGPAP